MYSRSLLYYFIWISSRRLKLSMSKTSLNFQRCFSKPFLQILSSSKASIHHFSKWQLHPFCFSGQNPWCSILDYFFSLYSIFNMLADTIVLSSKYTQDLITSHDLDIPSLVKWPSSLTCTIAAAQKLIFQLLSWFLQSIFQVATKVALLVCK